MSWVGQCRAVVVGAVVQVLTAVPFVLGAVVVARYGARAQRAAGAEVVRQGVPAGVLARHGISFGASGWDVPVAAGIALVLVALAVANLAGRPAARIVSYIAHPVLFVAGLLIVPGQVFTAWYLRRSFARSTDPDLHRLDASALVTATRHVFPGWLLPVDVAKLALTTVGSVLVVVALSTRASRAFFRRHGGARHHGPAGHCTRAASRGLWATPGRTLPQPDRDRGHADRPVPADGVRAGARDRFARQRR